MKSSQSLPGRKLRKALFVCRAPLTQALMVQATEARQASHDSRVRPGEGATAARSKAKQGHDPGVEPDPDGILDLEVLPRRASLAAW